jgi:hypothetical protein
VRAPARIPATRRAGERAIAAGYTAVVLYPGSAERHLAGLAADVTRVVHVATAEELDDVLGRLVPQGDERRSWVVSTHDAGLLARATPSTTCRCCSPAGRRRPTSR